MKSIYYGFPGLFHIIDLKSVSAYRTFFLIKLIIVFSISITGGLNVVSAGNIVVSNSSGYNLNVTGIQPGDTIFLDKTRTEPFILKNLKGDSVRPVIIINKGGSVTISGGNTGIKLERCKHIRISGAGVSGINYGIKLAGSDHGISVELFSDNVEIDHLEIAGTVSGGIAAFTDNFFLNAATKADSNFVLRNLHIHDNYIHHLKGGEGICVGPAAFNKNQSGNTLHAENIFLDHNLIEFTPGEGIQVGGMRSVKSKIFKNVIKYSGFVFYNSNEIRSASDNDQNNGILLGPGFSGECFNNSVEIVSGKGIQLTSTGLTYVYHNVIVNSGKWGVCIGNGHVPAGAAVVIFNNTIINPGAASLRFDPGKSDLKGYFYNNLVYGAPNNSLISKGNGGNLILAGNLAGSDSSAFHFQNMGAGDYRLLEKSLAIDTGINISGNTNIALKILSDFDGNQRTRGRGTDAGAFEFQGAGSYPVADAGPDLVITLPVNKVILKSGTSGDNCTDTLKYKWRRIAGPGPDPVLNSATQAIVAVDNLVQGTHTFELAVTNRSEFTSKDRVNVSVLPSPQGQFVLKYRVNAGGNLFSADPVSWNEDKQGKKSEFMDPRSPDATTGAENWVPNARWKNETGAPDKLFGSYRYLPSWNARNPIWYHFPVPNGIVMVNLYFAARPGEEGDAAGERVFNVNIEGGVGELSDFDIFREAEFNALKKSFTIAVTDGMLDIEFSRGKAGFPQINGIEILTQVVNYSPVAVAEKKKIIAAESDTVTVRGRAADIDGVVRETWWTKVSGPGLNMDLAAGKDLLLKNPSKGRYVFRFNATDNDNSSHFDEVQVDVVDPRYRINCGGAAVSSAKLMWSADLQKKDVSPYLVEKKTSDISHTPAWKGINNTGAPDNIFNDSRYTESVPISWSFPDLHGHVQIRIYFVSVNSRNPGKLPVFNIYAEDRLVLENYSLSRTSEQQAYVEVVDIEVNDNILNLSFIPVSGNPHISGIEILAGEDSEGR
jgi:hypothetical protein